jgi:hypothetical protein
MSSIGTGVAASVAQVAHNAQQTAKARDKSRADVQRAVQDDADRFEHRLHAAGQADDPDAELPDREAPGYEQLYLQDGDGQPLGPPDVPQDAIAPPPIGIGLIPPAPPEVPGPPAFPLYQHLDIQA